jgi:hypothetical protein
MAVCISSQVHTGLMSWSISRSGMTAESTVWKSYRVSLISQPRLHVSCRRVVRPSMEAGCCTIRREILPKTIVARLLSWAVCLQSRALRQGVFPGSNARTQLERREHGRAQRRLNGHIFGIAGLPRLARRPAARSAACSRRQDSSKRNCSNWAASASPKGRG